MDKSKSKQISVQIFPKIFEKKNSMDFTNRSKPELCKAFRQALGLITTEYVIELKAVDAKAGIDTTAIRNYKTSPRPEDVETVEAAFPGFKDVFLDYLNGGARWGRSKTETLKDAATKSLETNEAELKYWRELFVKTNEELKQVIYDMEKKEK